MVVVAEDHVTTLEEEVGRLEAEVQAQEDDIEIWDLETLVMRRDLQEELRELERMRKAISMAASLDQQMSDMVWEKTEIEENIACLLEAYVSRQVRSASHTYITYILYLPYYP